MDRINLLGCQIDKVSLDESIEIIDDYIRSKKPHQIVVVNAAKMVLMKKDLKLAAIIQNADLVGPDGVSIVWASRLLGTPLPERVNGTDLMERLVEIAAERHYSVYFFGAREEVVRKVAKVYRERFPKLEIKGWRNGYYKPEEEEKIVADIRKARPDILFVGMGTPMKEYWINRHLDALKVPVCHGVGGSFDVVAGFVKRAPLWMQRSGLEWFWRLLQEPKRMWKRYLITNSVFLYRVTKTIILTLVKKKN